MKKLLAKLKENEAFIKPASEEDIVKAEQKLNIKFSQEYKDFLIQIGCISYESIEIYGLGIPDDYYLNLLDIVPHLRNIDTAFPSQAIPISEIGDGHYYIYDNVNSKILIWAIPEGGIVKNIDETLDTFLINFLSV